MLDNQVNLLVQRIINKEKAAFEIVFNEYYKALCNYAFRFLDEYEEAEEIVQDVFVKFWEKCDTIAEDSSLKSYLYRSVHNTCLNHLKHLKVRDSYRQHIIEQMDHVEEIKYQADEDRNVQAEIYKAIDELPPQCQKIFKLSRFEGLKYQEIADHMGLSIKTIEVQMGKALRVLRESLKEFRR